MHDEEVIEGLAEPTVDSRPFFLFLEPLRISGK
jgi:hypothetical protein